MMSKAIIKMKNGKAAGSSGIVVETLKASGYTDVPPLVIGLANDMIRNGTISSNWKNSFITNIYKGRGDALTTGHYNRS